jgi:hypothetical protein
MYPQIPWQLVADPLGTAQYSLGTTEPERYEIQLLGVLTCEFSRVH